MSISESNISILLAKLKETVSQARKEEMENNAENWGSIGRGAKFDELGFESEEALKEWCANNPYSAI